MSWKQEKNLRTNLITISYNFISRHCTAVSPLTSFSSPEIFSQCTPFTSRNLNHHPQLASMPKAYTVVGEFSIFCHWTRDRYASSAHISEKLRGHCCVNFPSLFLGHIPDRSNNFVNILWSFAIVLTVDVVIPSCFATWPSSSLNTHPYFVFLRKTVA